jgi:hypothetical protein
MSQAMTVEVSDRDEWAAGGPAAEASQDRHIELVVVSLQVRLGASVDPTLIRAEVEAQFAAYAHARIRDYIPVLVEAQVRSRLVHPTGLQTAASQQPGSTRGSSS